MNVILSSRADFLRRILHQTQQGQPYWITSPPSTATLDQALALAKDDIGFENHVAHFARLVEIIDWCVEETINWEANATDETRATGASGPNTYKNSRVAVIAKLPVKERAGIACAAAQGLKWIDECKPCVPRHALPNEIAKSLMVGILVTAGRVKKAYSQPQIAGLANIAAASQNMELFFVRSREIIVEILVANVDLIPDDETTRTGLKRFVELVASHPANSQAVMDAIKKLRPVIKKR